MQHWILLPSGERINNWYTDTLSSLTGPYTFVLGHLKRKKASVQLIQGWWIGSLQYNADKFVYSDDICMGTTRLFGLVRSLWAVRSEGDVHVSSGADGVSGGEGARLWMLLDLRTDRGASVWSLHGHLWTGSALLTSKRGGKAAACSALRQRSLHERETRCIQTIA